MKKMQDMGGFFVAAVTPYDEQGRFSAPRPSPRARRAF